MRHAASVYVYVRYAAGLENIEAKKIYNLF